MRFNLPVLTFAVLAGCRSSSIPSPASAVTRVPLPTVPLDASSAGQDAGAIDVPSPDVYVRDRIASDRPIIVHPFTGGRPVCGSPLRFVP